MKTCSILSLLGFALGLSQAHASSLVNESFSYSAGNLIGNGLWTIHSGTADQKPIQVADGAITLTQSTGSGQDVSYKPGAPLPLASGQAIFASFDVSVTGSSASVYFAHFIRGSTIFDARIFIAPLGGADYTFGLGTGASPTATWATGLEFGETYTVVVAYDFDTGATRLWVDPLAESSTAISITGTAGSAIEGFGFRQAAPATASSQVIDNLKLGTAFVDVTSAIPEPGSYAAILGVIALAGVASRRRRA